MPFCMIAFNPRALEQLSINIKYESQSIDIIWYIIYFNPINPRLGSSPFQEADKQIKHRVYFSKEQVNVDCWCLAFPYT